MCKQQLVISVLSLPGHGKSSTSTDWGGERKKKPRVPVVTSCCRRARSSDQDLIGTLKPVETKETGGFKLESFNTSTPSIGHTAGLPLVVTTVYASRVQPLGFQNHQLSRRQQQQQQTNCYTQRQPPRHRVKPAGQLAVVSRKLRPEKSSAENSPTNGSSSPSRHESNQPVNGVFPRG